MPQVTIIRSDSTSSFIPVMDIQETTHSVDIESGAGQKTLVSDYNPASGNVRNRCLPSNSGDLIEISNNNYGWPKELRDKKQQQQHNKEQDDYEDQNERRTSGTSSEFKRGIHEHLISGKVPPIRERGLLNPHSGKGGINLADSLDNLASLIPR